MAVPRHVAYQINGTAAGGEIWTNTIRFSDDSSGAFTGLDLVAAVQQVKDRWFGMLEATDFFATSHSVEGVSGYVYNDAGVLTEQAATSDTPDVGTSPGILPHSTAVVASLLTAVPGARTRGRLYLPLCGLPLDSALLTISGTQRGVIATAVAGALNDLRTAGYDVGADGLDPVVVSTTATLATPITTVRVGSVPDVQRRRRNGLVEIYSSAAV